MGDLIHFPGKTIDPETAPRRADGSPVTECEERFHVFDSVPGRCQCGEHLWTELEIEQDTIGIHQPNERSIR